MTTTMAATASPADVPSRKEGSSEGMASAEEGSGAASATPDSDAGDSDFPDADESSASESNNPKKGGSLISADGADDGEEGANDNNDAPHTPQRIPSAAFGSPQSPIDYTKMDTEDQPYEHNFAPGDHIIRWDMLPILWPIQVHGIVLEVSADKSEVTICDFGVTSVKQQADAEGSSEKTTVDESQTQSSEQLLEEENAKFTEAIGEEGDDNLSSSVTTEDAAAAAAAKKEEASSEAPTPKKKNQRLHVRKLTKWSDLRKWHKINYEGGLLGNVGKGGMGKSIKNLGKKTEQLWTSMTKSFAKSSNDKDEGEGDEPNKEKAWRSVRYDVGENGHCVHHPDIQLRRKKDSGAWATARKKCPECIMEDCPAMMGEESAHSSRRASEASVGEQSVSTSDKEGGSSEPKSKVTEMTPPNQLNNAGETSSKEPASSSSPGQLNNGDTHEHSTKLDDGNGDGNGSSDSNKDPTTEPLKAGDEPKTLAEMIAQANKIDDKRSRKIVVQSPPGSPEKKPVAQEQQSWRRSLGVEKQKMWGGSLMKSLSSVFSQKDEKEASANGDTTDADTIGREETKSDAQPDTSDTLPRSDPPILVLARTRFILAHGEDILPPYHIINSNSECIAVWCKTGRWSTLQASVYLHSTAIGNAKSATALTLGAAAANPWLIPAFATVGLAAVGTPWLFLKVANDKWKEATRSLTEKFWMQAEPEVFVECIEKWGRIE